MPDARLTQASWTAGELSEELHGRRDLARYQVGAREMKNCAVSAKGGAFNRAGLRFAGEVKDHSKSYRLASFEAADDEAFLLVFGDGNMRPIFQGAYLDSGGGIPYEIATPWLSAELSGMYLEQTNDVMSIVHSTYSVRELSRFGVLDWRLSAVSFAPDAQPPNPLTVTGTQGYVGYGADKLPEFFTYKVASISRAGEESLPSNPYPSNISLVMGYDQNYVTISWSAVGVVVAGMDVPTGGVGAANESQFSRTFSLTLGATVTHIGIWSQAPVNNMRALIAERTGAGAITLNYSQTFNHPGGGWYDLELTPSPYVVPGAGTHYVGVYSPVGIKETASLSQMWTAGTLTIGPHVGLSEGTGSQASVRVRYQAADPTQEAVSYIVYKKQNGLYGYIGETPELTFKDTNFAPSFANGPQSGANPFVGAGNFPSVVSFLQQRRVFARTANSPQTIWLTQSGNFKNMGAASPIKDSDAFDFTIASRKKQDIYHLVPLEKGMIVFTRSGEWRVTGRDGDVLTPSSILPTPQSSYGAAKTIKPIVAGEQVLFVQRERKRIYEMEYSLEVDRFRANDLTLLSDHLFKNRHVVAWDHAITPDGIIWCVMSDGDLVSLTYLKEHEVWGFGRHETKGKFLDVAVVPENGRDVPYFIVQRRVGGQNKKFVEYLADRQFNDVRDGFFVDSGLSYDNPLAVLSVTAGAFTTVNVAAGHGLANGDVVELSGVAFYNADDDISFSLDGRWIVSNVAATSFRLTYEYDNAAAVPPVVAGDALNTSAYATHYLSTDGVFRRGASTFTGFGHLEGRKVAVLADGAVIENDVYISGGAFTLTGRFCRVHAGLPYQSTLRTLDIINSQGDDTGITKQVEQVFLRLLNTRGVKVGMTEATLLEMWSRDYENYGEPAALRSGLFQVDVSGDWTTNNGLWIVQDYPLPMMVTGLTTEQGYGGS